MVNVTNISVGLYIRFKRTNSALKFQFAMTYYEEELHRIKGICYSNQWQLDTVIATRNYIDNHFDEDLNLNVLAQIRFTSKYHLLRMFKRYYGQTPKQYLTQKRIEKAKEYLRAGRSVTETCLAVGFESPPSFSILFKNKTGQSPIDFQKEQLSI